MATRFIDKEYGVDTSTAIANDTTGTRKVQNLPDAAGFVYDKVDNTFKFNAAGTIKVLADTSTAQTLTNKTLTSPVLTSPTISGATITGVGSVQAVRNTAAFDVDSGTTGSTLTTLTGMSVTLVAGATYYFRVQIPLVVMTTNGGFKAAFKLTTATLTAVNARVKQSTDTDNTGAVSTSFVTTTDQATWFDQKAVVYTQATIEGTLTVGTGGTIDVQGAQNTSHADNTTIIAEAATAIFTRLA